MKKIIVLIAVLVFMAGVSYADPRTDILQGCERWSNISSVRPNINGVERISYCQEIGRGAGQRFGNVKSSYTSKKLGIGQDVSYGYDTFCNTFFTLTDSLTDDEFRKMIVLLAQPIKSTKIDIHDFALYILSPANIKKEVVDVALLSLDLEFYKDSVKRQKEYKEFYKSLFITDTSRARELINTVPDKLINEIDKYCTFLKQGGN